ncbi:MAG: protein kinase domain-containing protein, partial [Planctomycetota bacterium]
MTKTNEQYERAKDVFLDLCDLPSGDRAARLDAACAGDEALRAEVVSLLGEYDAAPERAGADAATLRREGPRQPPAPERIGHYRVLHELARGGMGIVYLGRDERFGRRVAIKVIKRGMDTEAVVRRFEQERQLLAALNHPNIARLYDGGETGDGVPYFVMELVEGVAIDEYCDVHRLSIGDRLDLFRQVCAAVHYAHQNLVVHRDLKPSNIIVTEDGVPKLLDFGIARLVNPEINRTSGDPTLPQLRVMTPEYASPEQVRGDTITTGSDVYSLGVLLYELVSGHRPYRLAVRSPAEIERAICESEPEKPSTAVSRIEAIAEAAAGPTSTRSITPESVSAVREGRPERLRRRLTGDIDNIVLKAMRKEPQRRYESAAEFADDLRRHREGRPVLARPDTLVYRASKFVRRNKVGTAAAAMVFLSLVGGLSGTSWQARVAASERATALAERNTAQSERDRFERTWEQGHAFANVVVTRVVRQIKDYENALVPCQVIVEGAVDYYEVLRAEGVDDPALQSGVADAMVTLGDIVGGSRGSSLGLTGEAVGHYEQSLELREELAVGAPIDAEVHHDVSVSLIKIGDMHRRRGDVAGALARYDEAIRIREARLEAMGESEATLRALHIALNARGRILERTGALADALATYERSLELRRGVVAVSDDLNDRRNVGVGLVALGRTLRRLGRFAEAVDTFEQAVRYRERLAPDLDAVQPGRGERDVAVARTYLGEVRLDLGDAAAAAEEFGALVALAERRLPRDPANARVRRDVGRGHENVGWARLAADDPAEAAPHFARFAEMADWLHEHEGGDAEYREMWADAREALGARAAAAGLHEEAIDAFRDALELVEVMSADAEDLRRPEARARLLRRLGASLRAAGRPEQARQRLGDAVDGWETLVARVPEDAVLRRGLRRALATL